MHSLPLKKLIVYSFGLLVPLLGFAQQKSTRVTKQWSFGQTEKATQIPLVQELMLDSINQRLNQLGLLQPALLQSGRVDSNGLPIKNIAQLKESLQKLQLSSRQKPFTLSGLSALYSLKEELPDFTKRPLRVIINEAKSTTVYDNQTLTDHSFISQSSLSFSTDFFGLPLTYKVINNYPAFTGQQLQPLFKVSFNQENLLKDLQQKLVSQFDIEKLLLKDIDFKNLFNQYGQKKLDALKQSALSVSGLPQSLLQGLDQLKVDEFLYLTKEQLSQRVLKTSSLDSLVQEKSTCQALLPLIVTTQERDSLQAKMNAVEESITKAETILRQLIIAKETFETKGLDYNQLVRYQQQVNAEVGKISSSPSFTQAVSKKLLNMKGITRLFMHVKELNIGQFSSNWSSRSLSDVLTSGIGGTYLNKNKFLGLTIANSQPLGWLKDHALSGSLSEPASRIQALRLGKGELAGGHNHFTLINATTKPISGVTPSLPALPRNIAVGSFSKNLSLSKYGQLEAEVSKSNSQYQHSSNAADNLESKVALRHLGADFFQTLSLGLQYESRFAKAGFEPQIYINYTGLGYSNPASALQARGSLQYGIQARKELFKNKLTLQTRFSKRDSRVTVLDDRKMHQVQSSVSARYRLSKKWRIGANWNYSNLSKEELLATNTLFNSSRIGADAFYNGRIWGKPFYQYIGSGYQQLRTPDLSGALSGRMHWINTSTNMAFTKGSLVSNLQFYNNFAAGAVHSNLLTADAGWNYLLLKRVQLNTALSFLNQQAIARQAGIRQTLSASLSKNISISVFADVKHNLIDNKTPFLYPKTRGELQVIYKLN